jgi:hypothetical protein
LHKNTVEVSNRRLSRDSKNGYLAALEAASAEQNIIPFANFIREEMGIDWGEVER